MEKELEEHFDRLAAMVAEGFAELRQEVGEIRASLEKNLRETQYLDRKLDNRFDLLERMLFDNLAQDRNRIAVVENKVKELSGV
jgi:hypothetical protein